MMKTLKYLIIAVVGALMFSSCSHEVNYLEERGEGLLCFKFGYDLETESVTKASTSDLVFKVDIINVNTGVIVKHFEDHRNIENTEISLRAGKYKVTAACGSNPEAAFDAPYYYGETVIDIVAGRATTANITCTLANVKVTVSISDFLKQNFKEYPVTISNLAPNGELLFEGATIDNIGYFRCSGTLMWTIVLTNNDGSQIEQPLSAYIDDVKPRQHYHFHFDVKEDDGQTGDGAMSIRVTVDGTLVDQEHDIDVSLNKDPMPTVDEANGVDITKAINIPQGVGLNGLFNITSVAGIEKIVLSHNSSVVEELGIPRSIDLISVNSQQYKSLGLVWTEDLAVGCNGLNIDFRKLLSEKLELGTYEFKINILDKQAQYVSVTLTFKVIPNTEVTTVRVNPWAKHAILYAQYNTEERPEGVGFQYKKSSDSQWTTFAGDLVWSLSAPTMYSAKVTGLEPNTSYDFRAVTAAEQKDENNLSFVTEDATQLPNFNFDNWCTSDDVLYPNADVNSNFFWDTGNEGAAAGGLEPTSRETSKVVSGSAVRMESLVALGVLAGGNIYSGDFVKRVGAKGAYVDFGRPYSGGRPTALHGHYAYTPQTIDIIGKNYKNDSNISALEGQKDIGKIFVVFAYNWSGPFRVNNIYGELSLFDPNDPSVIGYAELEDQVGTGGQYKEFTLDIEWRDTEAIPNYVILVACASKYADYFTGGEGSLMYIDEFEFLYE